MRITSPRVSRITDFPFDNFAGKSGNGEKGKGQIMEWKARSRSSSSAFPFRDSPAWPKCQSWCLIMLQKRMFGKNFPSILSRRLSRRLRELRESEAARRFPCERWKNLMQQWGKWTSLAFHLRKTETRTFPIPTKLSQVIQWYVNEKLQPLIAMPPNQLEILFSLF